MQDLRTALTTADASNLPLLGYVAQAPTRGLTILARELASRAADAQIPDPGSPNVVLKRLRHTRTVLEQAFTIIREADEARVPVGSVGEWLLDNEYLIADHFKSVLDLMPSGFYRTLPIVTTGPHAQHPRVFEVAMELMGATHGEFDSTSVDLFIREYQRRDSFTIGELWALPIFVRVALLANITRAAKRCADRLEQIALADKWAESMTTGPTDARLPTVRRFLNAAVAQGLGQSPVFTSRLIARLREHRHGRPALALLERFIAEEAVDLEAAARDENARLASLSVAMASSVTSLRGVQNVDWRQFFERHSKVDETFAADALYRQCTASTRNMYRNAIEGLSRRSKVSEHDVAKVCVELARIATRRLAKIHSDQRMARLESGSGSASAPSPATAPLRAAEVSADVSGGTLASAARGTAVAGDSPGAVTGPQRAVSAAEQSSTRLEARPEQSHIGYWAMDQEGMEVVAEVVNAKRVPVNAYARQWIRQHPDLAWFGLMGSLTAVVLWIFAKLSLCGTGVPVSILPVVAGVLLVLANDCAIALLTNMVLVLLPPRQLPRLNFERGIPKDAATVVVIPLLFTSPTQAVDCVRQLEARYLANRDQHVYFALLSDFTDASTETKESDTAVLDAARAAISELNAKYADAFADHQPFLLFHRPRLFNAHQGKNGVWMSWERKRGKIAQFIEYLLDPTEANLAPFNCVGGWPQRLAGVKYLVCLDADTVLPKDAVRLLVGTAAHPLNRPHVDPTTRMVTRGYAVFQPRVTTRLSTDCSAFARMFSGEPGVDVYTTAVSDVYMDLYGQGSFTGKGLLDIRAFHEATKGRFGEDEILSHDLIEGSYAGCALVTDVEVFDDYPSQYFAWAKRNHRWIRGDWQLLPWLLPHMWSAAFRERIGALPAISRWKILDNLRRSVVSIMYVFSYVLAWVALPAAASRNVTLTVTLAYFFPFVISFLVGCLRPPMSKTVSVRLYYLELAKGLRQALKQAVFMMAVMPHVAASATDAILRTLYRLKTRKNMLEWTTASQMEAFAKKQTAMMLAVMMWDHLSVAAVLLAIVVKHVVVGNSSPLLLVVQLVLLSAWMSAPWICHQLSSRVALQPRETLTYQQRLHAVRWALLHWRFFDSHVTSQTRFLAPDNVQEGQLPSGSGLARGSKRLGRSIVRGPSGAEDERVALRTSPTNIGLQLLSTISAVDLGFLDVELCLRTCTGLITSVEAMEHYRGHLFNWYEITTLRVLEPKYISTVDSGNLAGALLAANVAFREIAHRIRGGHYLVSAPQTREALMAVVDICLRLLGSSAKALGVDTEGQVIPLLRRGLGMLEKCGEVVSQEKARALRQILMEADSYVSSGTASAHREVHRWLTWAVSALQAIAPAHAASTMDPGRMAVDAIRGDLMHGFVNTPGTPKYDEHVVAALRAAPSSGSQLFIADELESLSKRCEDLARRMDFSFLYFPQRKLFSIGYNLSTGRLDKSTYDLLASESRLASFVAVASGDVPAEHWYRLGRGVTSSGGLISWTGTMFEYLMPNLLMNPYPQTVLERAGEACVEDHMRYAAQLGPLVPWGCSESAYNALYPNGDYMYRAFGAAPVALKRGMGDDYVVAPYASLLAMMVAPRQSTENLLLLEKLGALGPYGFRDAVDFSRPDAYQDKAVVRTYMAHHIGMGLVALNNVLNNFVWRNRFHALPLVDSASLLLHERVPKSLAPLGQTETTIRPRLQTNMQRQPKGENQMATVGETSRAQLAFSYDNLDASASEGEEGQDAEAENLRGPPLADMPLSAMERVGQSGGLRTRNVHGVFNSSSEVMLLGTRKFGIMLASNGSGLDQSEGIALQRWRHDPTLDDSGIFIYLRDLESRAVWSATYMPTRVKPEHYDVTFSPDRAVFHRIDDGISTRTTVCASTSHQADVRIVSIRNLTDRPRRLDVTSYCELVLQPMAADRAHPVFQNLFVTTEFLPDQGGLLALRRDRKNTAKTTYGTHVIAVDPSSVGSVDPVEAAGVPAMSPAVVGSVQYETDRAKFVRRGMSTQLPYAVTFANDKPVALSDTAGAPLDPIFSLRREVYLGPHETIKLSITTALSSTREAAVEKADVFGVFRAAKQTLELASAEAEEEAKELSMGTHHAVFFSWVFGQLMYRNVAFCQPDLLRRPAAVNNLWMRGISGDFPIFLCRISAEKGLRSLRMALLAHHFMRRKGMTVDLVIVNTQPVSYMQDLVDAITQAVHESPDAALIDKPGGVFVRREQLLGDSFELVAGVSRFHLDCDKQNLVPDSFLHVPDPSYAHPNSRPEFQRVIVPAAAGGMPSVPSLSALDPAEIARLLTSPELADTQHVRGIRKLVSLDDATLERLAGIRDELAPDAELNVAERSALRAAVELAEKENPEGFMIAPPAAQQQDGPAEPTGCDVIAERTKHAPPPLSVDTMPPLRMFNGWGGLNEDDDYEVRIVGGKVPPAAWSNVMSMPHGFGTVFSDLGGGYSWFENSVMYRVTPWINDAVVERPVECIYLRDDASGDLWSATPLPVFHRDDTYRVIHSPGVTTHETEHGGIRTHLSTFVHASKTVKVSVLRVTNCTATSRAVSACAYTEWCLGEQHHHTQHQAVTFPSHNFHTCAARYFDALWAPVFAVHASSSFVDVAYDPANGPTTTDGSSAIDGDAAASGASAAAATTQAAAARPRSTQRGQKPVMMTTDRRDFLGRSGSVSRPLGLMRDGWAHVALPGSDSCSARLHSFMLRPGQSATVVVVLGATRCDDLSEEARMDAADALVDDLMVEGGAVQALSDVRAQWRQWLSMATVKTGDAGFDAMASRWLPYQVLSCRLWGRSSIYQSGGAFGFRDQLQDAMSVAHIVPRLVRAHLLLCARRQFEEGDVMHWWHEPEGRGVRTKISDDLLFLPYVTVHYINVTGDIGVLAERVPYITMRQLKESEDDVYDLPSVSSHHGTLLEHCMRAIRRADTTGRHGLPLIGAGDWNDGMNRVGGEKNRGESVWLGWFLGAVAGGFLEFMQGVTAATGHALLTADDVTTLTRIVERCRRACDAAWDGRWFMRAFFHNGKPLGSSRSRHCKIDAIAQAWSAISGLGEMEKVATALDSVDAHLVDRTVQPGIIKLLDPAFTPEAEDDPGYIAAYIPGVRENGAQYTHAAVWVALANAVVGRADRAHELYRMLLPLYHADTPENAAVYKVEPYVVAADVYSMPQHAGRGGWSWYTGSAAWMLRTAVEALCGIRFVAGDWKATGDGPARVDIELGENAAALSGRVFLEVSPVVPSGWKELRASVRHGPTTFDITVSNPDGLSGGTPVVSADGVLCPDRRIPVDAPVGKTGEKQERTVTVTVEMQPGPQPAAAPEHPPSPKLMPAASSASLKDRSF
eukprot:TRINITY_DN747_c0_g2_i1.p1 TRINITY_DN747_c0_g2~~TRINITY_DN747_c0_g2_i1.p1  ORF type:complete len:3343 (-),score=1011.01 TRINITY_DN747_c0_g2_i1:227-10255(-)